MSFNPLTASPGERAVRYRWALKEPFPGASFGEPPTDPPEVILTDEKQAKIVELVKGTDLNRTEIGLLVGATPAQVRTVQRRMERGVENQPVRRSHRLTAEEVFEIRDAYDPINGINIRVLAARYRVRNRTISAALRGERS